MNEFIILKLGTELNRCLMKTEEQLSEMRDQIVKGLEETYRRLIEFKKQKNSPMIISRDGKIVAVDAHELPPTTTYRRGKTAPQKQE